MSALSGRHGTTNSAVGLFEYGLRKDHFMQRELLGFAALTLLSAAAIAQNGDTLRSKLIDTQGKEVGSIVMQETPDNGVLLKVSVAGLPSGPRAIHIHETGKCEGE